MFLLTCYAIIAGVTAGGVGVIWSNVDSDEEKKDENRSCGSSETHATSSAEWSVYI